MDPTHCQQCVEGISYRELHSHNCTFSYPDSFCGMTGFDRSMVFAGPTATMRTCWNASGHFTVGHVDGPGQKARATSTTGMGR